MFLTVSHLLVYSHTVAFCHLGFRFKTSTYGLKLQVSGTKIVTVHCRSIFQVSEWFSATLIYVPQRAVLYIHSNFNLSEQRPPVHNGMPIKRVPTARNNLSATVSWATNDARCLQEPLPYRKYQPSLIGTVRRWKIHIGQNTTLAVKIKCKAINLVPVSFLAV